MDRVFLEKMTVTRIAKKFRKLPGIPKLQDHPLSDVKD